MIHTRAAGLIIAVAIAAGAGCYSGAEVATNGTSGGAGGSGVDTSGGDGGTSGTAGNDPFGAAPTCTSGRTTNISEGSGMAPGDACISCHAANGGPSFQIAGTVFPTGHEPNNCLGANGSVDGLKVVITDANNKVVTISVNSAGNFDYGSRSGAIAMPYHAKVVNSAGAERSMSASQTSGDCNSCHTQNGANGAPGRIVAP